MFTKPRFILLLWILALIWPFQMVQSGTTGLDRPENGPDAGSLDPYFGGFGSDGTKFLDFGPGNDTINALAAEPFDGKIIAVGPANLGFAVSRFLADGDLDPTFDKDGKVTISFNGQFATAYAAAVQPDQKILVVGYAAIGGDYDFALARLNPDGSLDTSFGSGGKVTTGFGADEKAFSMAIQADGKILAGGNQYECGFTSCDDDFALARYTSDGKLDPSFDGDGKLTVGLGGHDVVNTLAVMDDGKIVAGGYQMNAGAAVARFLPDGTPDSSFDSDGLFSTGLVGYGRAMAVQSDHEILLAGDKGLARLKSDGSLDLAFGKNGFVSIDATPLNLIKQMVLLPNRKFVIGGLYYDPAKAAKGDFSDFGLVRFDASGKMDLAFGGGSGYVANSIPVDALNSDILNAMIQAPNGELVAAGHIHFTDGNEINALARYLPDGTLDSTGKVLTKVTDFEGIDDTAAGVAILSDGRVIAAGSADTGPFSRVGAARYTPRGLLDDGFGDHGLLRSGVASGAQGIATDNAGDIFIAASRFSHSTDFDFALLKFKPDGSTLSPGFGTNGNGFVTTDFGGGTDQASALALLSQGGIAVAGTSGLDFALARYTSSGLPDPSFNQTGMETTGFSPDSVDVANAVLGQPDGRILVAGRSKAAGSENDDFAVARYNPDGTLDTTFDGDGLLTVDLAGEQDIAYDLALQPDGRILVGGTATVSGFGQMALVRLNEDGSLDTTFGDQGKALLHTGFADNTGYAIQRLPTGKIAIAGCAINLDLGSNDIALALLNPDGSPDTSFSNDGIETYGLGGESCARDLAFDGQRLILAGYASNGIHDNYALVSVVLLSSQNAQFNRVFLPAVFK